MPDFLRQVKPSPSTRVRFAAFELDLTSGELRSLEAGSVKVLLREQAFQVLRMLVERRGKLVTREEIRKKLWPNDTIVDFDHSINATIKTLRRALGDSADDPQYIETLARRGYRLRVPIEWMESTVGFPHDDILHAQVPPDSGGLIGKKVSHYRVLEVIGAGGMGMVYKAEDLKLGRRVALKFLPEELASDPVALKRFEREAQTASALNHPNICTIYEIEEHQGQPFIVMELLEGRTLRHRIAASETKPLPLAELFDIAIQICDGLQAAHEMGIIHRDIKPANIFLTRQGPVKILDFGLAKLAASKPAGEKDETEASSETPPPSSSSDKSVAHAEQVQITLTSTGTAAGTAAYMSPEQVRKEELDGRSDLFSFGMILYEMATGRCAFTGATVAEIHNAILNQTPAPVHDLNSAVPRSLDAVITKALEKSREKRYQSAAAMSKDLVRVQRQVQPRLRLRKWFAAAALLAVVVFVIWRYEVYRHRITLSPTDTIVLSDVDNQTGDPVFDDALNIALRYEMQQTPYLNILGIDKASATLAQLKLPPTTRITPDVARQICGRTNSKMVISQSIADAGNRYHLEMRAIDCGSGATLGKEQADIGSRNEVIHELGVTAVRLRAKLGEPADSLARFNQPLEKALSASLEALQAGAQGTKLHFAGDVAGAVKLYQRAVELDPNLALTYEGMGAAYNSLSNTELSEASFTRAYQLRDRLTERDRLNAEITYYGGVTGQWEREYSIVLRYLELFPRDVVGHNNLAAALLRLGQPDRAADEISEAARLNPNPYYSWIAADYNLIASRFNEAKSWFKKADDLNFDNVSLRIERLDLAYIEGDQITIDSILGKEERGPDAAEFLFELSRWATFQGRFHYADRLAPQIQKLPNTLPYLALSNAETGRLTEEHKAEEEALRLKLDPGSRMVLALALARSGKTEQAGKIADEVSAEAPLDTVVQYYLVPTVRAAIKLQQHDPAAAIELLRATTKYDLSWNNISFDFLYPAYVRGQAYLALGDGRSAAGEFQKLIDHPGLTKYHVTGPLALLQLGRAQKVMGDEAAARNSYEKFLNLWKDADPDLPIYQQAKAEYARLEKETSTN